MTAIQEATFGAGCFWCIEPAFIQLKGVSEVYPGYAGGHIKNPAYREVCTGKTGHAEVIRIVYDSNLISFGELLEYFWFLHDPTTLNRQGNDVGEQYKSVVYYHNDEQKKIAEEYKIKLDQSGIYKSPIVTEISPLSTFYEAEKNHREYYRNNPEQSYCHYVIRPKLEKFEAVFKYKLKAD